MKFAEKGEKTGWTYLLFEEKHIQLLQPGVKLSFRVKGLINGHQVKQQALLPMGEGEFILPLNADVRKKTGVRTGYSISVDLELDKSPLELLPELEICLADDPPAKEFFYSLPRSHQMYFSRWIDSAKTEGTRTKRIAMTVNAAAQKMGYSEMIRASQKKRQSD
jgi:hypothetical protein